MSFTIDQVELLDDTGCFWELVGIRASRLVADYGDGFTAAARVGSKEGLRAWRLKVDVLPDLEQYRVGEYTRARYLWEFWRRHKLEHETEVFLMRDPFPASPDRPYVFARFAEDELEFSALCDLVFTVGVNLIQARLPHLDANTYGQQQI